MHVSKNGTIYDVYVKNDRLYDRLYGGKSAMDDNSLEDYENKLRTNIAELRNVSSGDIQMHVLPESAMDKSSSATENIEDDIIGVAIHTYHYEGDEVGSVTNDIKIDFLSDKKSLQAILDKIRFIYSKDEVLGKALDENSSYKNTTMDLGNGYTVSSTDSSTDPFKGAIAYLNEQLSQDGSLGGGDLLEAMLKKMIEDMKKDNESTLLDSVNASKRLAGVFNEIKDARKEDAI